MAGAGQPWYMPLLWPVAHVTNAIFKPETEKVPKNVAAAKLDTVGHLTAIFAALRSFSLAYIAIYWLYDDFDYPAFGAGKTSQNINCFELMPINFFCSQNSGMVLDETHSCEEYDCYSGNLWFLGLVPLLFAFKG